MQETLKGPLKNPVCTESNVKNMPRRNIVNIRYYVVTTLQPKFTNEQPIHSTVFLQRKIHQNFWFNTIYYLKINFVSVRLQTVYLLDMGIFFESNSIQCLPRIRTNSRILRFSFSYYSQTQCHYKIYYLFLVVLFLITLCA